MRAYLGCGILAVVIRIAVGVGWVNDRSMTLGAFLGTMNVFKEIGRELEDASTEETSNL